MSMLPRIKQHSAKLSLLLGVSTSSIYLMRAPDELYSEKLQHLKTSLFADRDIPDPELLLEKNSSSEIAAITARYIKQSSPETILRDSALLLGEKVDLGVTSFSMVLSRFDMWSNFKLAAKFGVDLYVGAFYYLTNAVGTLNSNVMLYYNLIFSQIKEHVDEVAEKSGGVVQVIKSSSDLCQPLSNFLRKFRSD
jgi:hypothetical protein